MNRYIPAVGSSGMHTCRRRFRYDKLARQR